MNTPVIPDRRKPLTRKQRVEAHDITNKRFGRLVAREQTDTRVRGQIAWICECECGAETISARAELLRGRIKSCGSCSRKITHGLTNEPGFDNYRYMIRRCEDETNKDFHRYGGLGIRVCHRWVVGDGNKTGAECFFEDMGPRPSDRHSIDRIDNSIGYDPSNCRWALPEEQQRNRRDNYFSRDVDPRGACAAAGVNYSTFRARVARGISVQDALTSRDLRRRAR